MGEVLPPSGIRSPSGTPANAQRNVAPRDRHADGAAVVVDGRWLPRPAGEATLRSGCGDAVTSAMAEVYGSGAGFVASRRRDVQCGMVCCKA
jgi:hypothetical protein